MSDVVVYRIRDRKNATQETDDPYVLTRIFQPRENRRRMYVAPFEIDGVRVESVRLRSESHTSKIFLPKRIKDNEASFEVNSDDAFLNSVFTVPVRIRWVEQQIH